MMKHIFKWIYEPSGQCPVQADGIFLGYYFYFRSRWSKSVIEFYDNETDYDLFQNPVRVLVLKETDEYLAGWISHDECRQMIYKACWRFFIMDILFK